MNRVLVLGLATSVLAGCATTPPAPPPPPPPAVVEAVPPAPSRPRLPNRNMAASASIPRGWTRVLPRVTIFTSTPTAIGRRTRRSRPTSRITGSFSVLQDLSQQRVRDILDAAKDDPTSRIGMAYSSFLDEAGVEAKGLAPIQPWLDQVRALKSRGGYAALEGEAARNGVTGLFGGGVTQDDRNTDCTSRRWARPASVAGSRHVLLNEQELSRAQGRLSSII